jgi:beta-lactamase class A
MKSACLGLAVLIVFSFTGAPALAPASPSGLERLRAAMEEVARTSRAEVGVALKHLPSGAEISLRGAERFPMASTFKVPILVELFNQVDAGRIRLEERVELAPEHLHLGSGLLKEFLVPGVSLSVENLSLLMMRVSDNSATDYLLEKVGLENVNARLAKLGIEGISVNRSCQRLILDWMGIDPERTRGLSYAEVEKMLNDYQPKPGELEAAAARAADDPQDTATPAAMNRLLEKIVRGEAASPESCRRMVDIMLKCDTGTNRLRGLLPAAVQVAHKTGSIGGTVNDVGIIYLPEGRGEIVLSVLVKKGKSTEDSERAIANLARYAYDYFLFVDWPPRPAQ